MVDRDTVSKAVLFDIGQWLWKNHGQRLMVISSGNKTANGILLNIYMQAYKMFYNDKIYHIHSDSPQAILGDFEKLGLRMEVLRSQDNDHIGRFFSTMFEKLAQTYTLFIFHDAQPPNNILVKLNTYIKNFEKTKILIISYLPNWDPYLFKTINPAKYKDTNFKKGGIVEFITVAKMNDEDYMKTIYAPRTPKSVENYLTNFIHRFRNNQEKKPFRITSPPSIHYT